MDIYVYNGKALQYNGKCISPKATGETWLLNELINTPSTFDYTTNFISNSIECVRIVSGGKLGPEAPNHDLIYFSTDGTSNLAFAGEFNLWSDQAYRTLTFLEPPTGELLAWLKANGTKQ